MTADTKYPVGFYFSLSFNGEDAAFQEVSGITKEMHVEEVVSGGENRFKYRLPAVSTNQNLILKRALVPAGSQLINWCASSLDAGLANPVRVHDVSVSLLGADGLVCSKWTFYRAYPVKYSISDFKSQESGIVIESIELAYTYFLISKSTFTYSLFT